MQGAKAGVFVTPQLPYQGSLADPHIPEPLAAAVWGIASPLPGKWRVKTHLLFTWADQIVHHPAILGIAPIARLFTEAGYQARKTTGKVTMRHLLAAAALTGGALFAAGSVWAQGTPPMFATTKVEGTDNVYVFRYQGHQAMFVVTSDGVIATDPIGLGRPQAVTTYIDEIRKVTSQPIRYVIYSHSHYDHITGGQPFKDAGARFIAHANAKARLEWLQPPNIVLPDEVVGSQRTLTLGGTTLELMYVGRNHSDSSLVMRLPKEKIIFAVDFIPVQAVHWRNMPDSWLDEWEESLKRVLAMDWDRLIPGHPGPGGRLGNKQDVRNLLQYMGDLAAEVKKAADEGKCYDTAMKEVKLPKYESWGNYGPWLPGNVERYCLLYRSGF